LDDWAFSDTWAGMATRMRKTAEDVTIWGIHPVSGFLTARPEALKCIFVLPTFGRTPVQRDLMKKAEGKGVRISKTLDFSALHIPSGTVHQGVAARVRPAWIFEFHDLIDMLQDSQHLMVMCDQVTDPQNLGAIIRSSVAFGADGIVVPERSTAPITGVVAKASSGAIARARICPVVNLANAMLECRRSGIRVTGLSPAGRTALWDADFTGACALVIGAEGKGLRHKVEETCDVLVRIPHSHLVESINVAAAAGIALYEAARQRAKAAQQLEGTSNNG